MNLKIKYSTLGKLCIILLLIVHARYFYLFSLGYNRTLLMSYLALLSLLFSWLYVKNLNEVKFVISFLIVLGVSFAYSWLNYDTSLSAIYSEAVEYVAIVFAVSVYGISKSEKSVKWIEVIIIIIGAMIATILTLQGLILTPRGIKLFNVQYSARLDGIRFVNSTEPILFGAVLSFARLLRPNKKKSEIVIFSYIIVVSTIELVYVAKTRALLVIYFVTLIIMLWNAKVASNKKEFFRKTATAIIICCIVMWGMNTKIARMYFSEYESSVNTQYDTLSIRNKEMEYAIKMLKEDSITGLVGTGFVSDTNTGLGYNGNTLKGLRTDIGIVGFINQFGIIGLIWIMTVLVFATKILWKNRKRKEKSLDYIGLYSIFIMGFPTLFLFNGERLVYFPIWLGITMFYNYSDSISDEEVIVDGHE